MSTPARERIQKILGGSPKYVPKAGRSFPKAGWYLQKEGGWKYLGRNAEEVICTSAKYRQKKQLTRAQALAAAQTLSLEELQQILREEHGEEYGEALKDLKAQEPPQAEQEQLSRMKAILGGASPPPAIALPPSAPAPFCRCKSAAPALPAPAGGLVPVRPAIIEVEPIEMPGAGLVARARQILAGAPLLPASPVRGLLPAPQPAPSADPPGDESSPGSMEAAPPVEAAAVEPAQRVGTATYDPADNKLRLTPFKRLDREVYERVKAAGFIWAPKQQVFIASAWTPEREDLLLELAGDIEDEDTTLVDRAAVRAERFEEYSEKREQDAERARQAVSAIADNIPLGQPILVGHHSERRARRDAERIRRGMRKAVDLWHTSQYWEHRAKAALRHAKYKERPDVRHRRIKGLEADLRKQERELADAQRFLKLWSVQPLTQERALAIADVHGSGPWGLWSELRDGKITAAGAAAKATEVLAARLDRAERWIEHVQNRLAYERTMLQEAVGESYEEKWKDVEPGGRVLIGNEWSVILRVNRKGGKIVSVTTNRRYVPVVGIELIQNYEPPSPEVAAKVKAATALPPLVNYPGQGFRHMTRDEWERSQRASDFYHVKKVAASENAGAHRLRTGPKGGGAPSWDTTGIYLTDQPRKDPPSPETGTERTEARRALDEQREPVIRPRPARPKKEPTVFDQMAESLKSGVQVVQAEQLFPTPPELARRLVDEAGIRPEHHVLEPSAGTGNLVQAILETGLPPEHLHCIEINHALADALRHRWPQVTVDTVDFMTWQAPRQYERIVMNPPFAQGQDIQHIKRAYNMLAPGGLLVALCANGARQNEQLKPMIEEAGGTWERLPPGSFTQQGTNVSVVLLTLPAREKDKPGPERVPSFDRQALIGQIEDLANQERQDGQRSEWQAPDGWTLAFVGHERACKVDLGDGEVFGPYRGCDTPVAIALEAIAEHLGLEDKYSSELPLRSGALAEARAKRAADAVSAATRRQERSLDSWQLSRTQKNAQHAALPITQALEALILRSLDSLLGAPAEEVRPLVIWDWESRAPENEHTRRYREGAPFLDADIEDAWKHGRQAMRLPIVPRGEPDPLQERIKAASSERLYEDLLRSEGISFWGNGQNLTPKKVPKVLQAALDAGYPLASFKAWLLRQNITHTVAKAIETWQPTPLPGDESSPSPPLLEAKLEAKLAEVREKRHKAERAMHRHKEKMGSKPSAADFDKEELLVRDWRQLRHQEDELARRLDAARGVSPALGERLADAAQDLAAQAKAALPVVQDAASAAVAKVVEVVREVASAVAPSLAEPATASAAQDLDEIKRAEQIEGPSCPADQEECSYGLLGGACGLPAPLYLPGAAGPQERPARYCLIDARKLKPSHNPLAGFTPTPGYPKDTQERVYQHDKAEQEKVYSIGQKLKPAIVFQPSTDGINGPPITTEDGIVLGGNGRAQGLIVHYAEGGTTAKEYLLKHAPVYGFSRAQVERIEQPVIVRVLRAPGQDLVRLVRLLNIPLTQGLDARAEAVGEARRLSGGVLQVLAAALSEDQTLAEYLSSADSRALVDELKRSEVITARNVKRYLDDRGLLNPDGRQMVERLLAAALLPDAPLLDDLGSGTQNVLARGAPYLLAASTSGPEWDLRSALRAAAKDLVELRRQGAHSVSEYLRQGALLPDTQPATSGVPLGRELLEILYALGQKPLVFARFAQAYARAAAQNPAGQGALFAEEKLTPMEALRRAAALAGVML